MTPEPPVKTVPEVSRDAPGILPERAKTPSSALIEHAKNDVQLIPEPVIILMKSVEGKEGVQLNAGDFEPKLKALSAGLLAISEKAGDPGEAFSKVFADFKSGAGKLKNFPARATVSLMEIKDQSVLGLLFRVTPDGFKRCVENNASREGFFGVFVTQAEGRPRLTLHEFDKLEAFDGFDATLRTEKLPQEGFTAALCTFKTSNIEDVIKEKVSRGLYCEPGSDPSEYSRTFSTVFVFEKGVLQAMRTLLVAGVSSTVGANTKYNAKISWISTVDGVFLVDTVVEYNEYPDTTGQTDQVKFVCSKVDYLFDAGSNGFLRPLTTSSVEKLRAVKGYEKVKKDVEHGDRKNCQALLKF